ncbi:MAG: hypothetical protein [Bacteriophage sp.]|nr:MAG: hypothetical protein [Bacteriophage sp.]
MKVDIHTMEGLLSGKCLPANMLVNESLSAYLVRQFEALHDRAEAAERERDDLKEQLRSVNNALELSDQYCDTDYVMDELGICYEDAELRANGAIALRDGVDKLRFMEVK